MGAVFKREFKTYFTSPLGYLFFAFMWAFSAYFFVVVMANSQYVDITYVFGNMFTIVTFLIPLLTMRLMSEDKKLKTDQLLLTSPIGIGGMVIGKYLAAITVFLISMLPNVLYIIIMSTYTVTNWNIFLGNFLGLFLVGIAMIAIGLLISSLTESQIVSAIGTYAILLFVMLFDDVIQLIPADLAFFSTVLGSMSFMSRYSDFVSGILNISHLLFFLSVSVAFLFLTIRVLEKKRWS